MAEQSAEGAEGGSSSFIRELEIKDKTIRIKQLYVGDVGCVVWDAAIVLCKFLENNYFFPVPGSGAVSMDESDSHTQIFKSESMSDPSYWNGKRVIDIGSGTGVVGIVAGVLGANVTITDLPDFVELMSTNIGLNKQSIKGSVTAKPLTWGQDTSSFLPKPEVILMADVVYYEQSLDDLVKTLVELSGETTTVIMCYEERTTGNKPEVEAKFFKLMESSNFHKTIVPYDKLDDTYRSRDIHVVIFNNCSVQ